MPCYYRSIVGPTVVIKTPLHRRAWMTSTRTADTNRNTASHQATPNGAQMDHEPTTLGSAGLSLSAVRAREIVDEAEAGLKAIKYAHGGNRIHAYDEDGEAADCAYC
jgi:hypothetical protein